MVARLARFALLGLAACAPDAAPKPEGCTDEWFADVDGDTFGAADTRTIACVAPAGFVADGTDCDDTRASVFPGAAESCDGLDDDCDGATDEPDAADAATWYGDGDGDGYGDAWAPTVACAAPAGFVGDATDCDDTDASSNPGAPEVCDGVSNDCDIAVDEPDAADAGDWYADADGDGYGDPATGVRACDAPIGFVADATDCDDADDDVFPGAWELCNETDDDCDGEVDDPDAIDAITWYTDFDADGWGDPASSLVRCYAPGLHYTEDASDCDDTDRNVSPDADEYCDGRDEDCDGTADDAALDADPYWTDADGDLYGDPATRVEACTQPAGTVRNDRDCDDTDAAFNPGATEACGDPDYDCDGVLPDDDRDGDGTIDCEDCDPDDPSRHPGAVEDCRSAWDDDCDGSANADDALGCESWYADDDGDGYGDATDARCLCDADGAWSAQLTGDCDVADAAVHPGADEDCATAADDDCDGDDNDVDALGCTTWYADADADGWGEGTGACLCVQADAATVSVEGDCDGTDPARNPGEAEVCADGVDQDCDGHAGTCGIEGQMPASDAGATLTTAESDDMFGYAVAGVGDLDGDGYADVLIGAPYWDGPGGNDGGAYVVYGPLSGAALDTDADAVLTGLAKDDHAGGAVAGAGDTDGDGVPEVLVGAGGVSADAGAVYLLVGAPSGTMALSSADATLEGVAADDGAGAALAGVGDTDGDGYDDVFVGAPSELTLSGDAGAAYLVRGPFSGTASLSTADTILLGAATGDRAGEAVDGAGDLDGDGLADLVVGARGEDSGGSSAGAAYVFAGPLGAGALSVTTADALVYGARGEYLGYDVAGAGDTDGDGYDDLLVGVPQNDATSLNGGAVLLLRGPVSGTLALPDAHAVLYGDDALGAAGLSVDGADLDADGRADVIVGGTHFVAVVYGPVGGTVLLAAADAVISEPDPTAGIGYELAAAGDTDGDGYDDLLLGTSTAASRAGWVFLLSGGPGL